MTSRGKLWPFVIGVPFPHPSMVYPDGCQRGRHMLGYRLGDTEGQNLACYGEHRNIASTLIENNAAQGCKYKWQSVEKPERRRQRERRVRGCSEERVSRAVQKPKRREQVS